MKSLHSPICYRNLECQDMINDRYLGWGFNVPVLWQRYLFHSDHSHSLIVCCFVVVVVFSFVRVCVALCSRYVIDTTIFRMVVTWCPNKQRDKILSLNKKTLSVYMYFFYFVTWGKQVPLNSVRAVATFVKFWDKIIKCSPICMVLLQCCKQAFARWVPRCPVNAHFFKENYFIFHMLSQLLFIWADPVVHFGCPLFKSWLKAWL